MILYETDEQRAHVHTGWEKVEAIDETYWRCTGCKVTADNPVPPEDDPKEPNQMSTPSKDREQLRKDVYQTIYHGLTMAEADHYTDWVMGLIASNEDSLKQSLVAEMGTYSPVTIRPHGKSFDNTRTVKAVTIYKINKVFNGRM